MNQRLNSTQQKLVEDNHNLIYSFLQSRHLSCDAVEDWYGAAAIGLCKAALAYDETRDVKFSTLAYIVMENEIRTTMRKDTWEDLNMLSLDDIIQETGTCRVGDTIQDPQDFTDTICLYDAIDISSKNFNDRDKEILKLLYEDGMRQELVANHLNISRTTVSRIHNKFIQSLHTILCA